MAETTKPDAATLDITEASRTENIPSRIETIDPNPRLFLDTLDRTAPIVVVIGRAGTGKTTLIRSLMASSKVKQAVIAPTGVAALNVGGQTIHSFLRIPLGIVNPADLEPVRGGHHLFKNLERLIIDEISMVRADLLDSIDHALRINRHSDRPFGGVQIVMVGDFLQLPPVVPKAEGEALTGMGYKTPYALSAKGLRGLDMNFFEMDTVHRQDDPVFIEMLGQIRNGENLQANIRAINEKCHGPHKGDLAPVILTGTNDAASSHNREKLALLSGISFAYEGVVVGQFERSKELFPAPEYLELKLEARVILVKNDVAKRWVNGTLATVVRLETDAMWVCIDGTSEEEQVLKATWESIRYVWNAESEQIERTIVGSYTQFPLQLAWAMTIHKSQGLTLQNVLIDLRGGAFSDGQTYVALSRAKSLDGLSLARPLNIADVRVNYHLLQATRYISERDSHI